MSAPVFRWLLRGLLALLAVLALQGCASRPERVILLPGSEGHATGALLVQRGTDSLRLAQPYAQAQTSAQGTPQASVSDAATVQRDFGSLLAITPPFPRSFIVTFLPNSNTLTPATLPVLKQVREALDAQPAGELVVIGHTDNVGTAELNDRLSLDRAQKVADLLAGMGVARELISVQARGMREPLVEVPPQTDEPRNRRVEIKLR
ncbi:OmpA family protein [Paucibacter sp. R3-3]|uniref:OmpA family protein n=1 Tax=Roseateles agri TaxID=3098619 RepID=A0ABU5DBV3_9BURK|nr:OmpA family protein [Paucibacter sp. R3-3]